MRLEKRRMIICSCLTAVLVFLYAAGWTRSVKYHTGMQAFDGIRLPGGGWYLIGILMLPGFYWLFGYLKKDRKKVTSHHLCRWYVWPTYCVLLMVCWLPVLAAAYPGFYNYDVAGQLPQAMYASVPYNTHHSLLHTLIMGKVITWGYQLTGMNITKGILLHSIFQMLLCALVFTFVVRKIVFLTDSLPFLILSFLYYAFFPVIAMFSMSTTKDVLCSLFLLLAVVFLYSLLQESDKKENVRHGAVVFVLSAVLMGLFRKNGVYALVLLFVLVLAADSVKKYQKLMLIGSSVVLCLLLNHLLAWGLQAQEGSKVEAFSVPLQQVARVYADKGREAFSEDEWRLLETVASEEVLRGYEPVQADSIKNFIRFSEIEKAPLDYLELWFSLFCRYPGLYLDAFLDNTYQAWYPWTNVVDDTKNGTIYYFDMEMRGGMERFTKSEKLLDFYNGIASEDSFQKIPVVRLLFSMGAMLWLLLILLAYGIYAGKREFVWPMLLVLAYCATSMLGPVALVRYYLILFYCFPIGILFLFRRDGSTRNGGERSKEEEK